MKAILMSIKPQHVANILNKIKTLEIRKKFPKDYVGWVYIYCTREQLLFICKDSKGLVVKLHKRNDLVLDQLCSHGKVVARFWCDKVEEIKKIATIDRFATDTIGDNSLLISSCLEREELHSYLKGKKGYAIHITNLKPFDKPKEISEFYGAFTQKRCERIFGNNTIELDKKYGVLRQPTRSGYEYTYPLTRAPQSWCYIEV